MALIKEFGADADSGEIVAERIVDTSDGLLTEYHLAASAVKRKADAIGLVVKLTPFADLKDPAITTKFLQKLAVRMADLTLEIDGPDFEDGHDYEGFPGGCERFGCGQLCIDPKIIDAAINAGFRRSLGRIVCTDTMNRQVDVTDRLVAFASELRK
jgi:hypothetical protein